MHTQSQMCISTTIIVIFILKVGWQNLTPPNPQKGRGPAQSQLPNRPREVVTPRMLSCREGVWVVARGS